MMEFEVGKFIWQVVNFAILLGILAVVVALPILVYRKINLAEKRLGELALKLDRLTEKVERLEK